MASKGYANGICGVCEWYLGGMGMAYEGYGNGI